MLSKNIEWSSLSLVAHKEGGTSLFYFLFGVASGSFQPVLAACYGVFTTRLQNGLISKLTLNQLQVHIMKKWSKLIVATLTY